MLDKKRGFHPVDLLVPSAGVDGASSGFVAKVGVVC